RLEHLHVSEDHTPLAGGPNSYRARRGASRENVSIDRSKGWCLDPRNVEEKRFRVTSEKEVRSIARDGAAAWTRDACPAAHALCRDSLQGAVVASIRCGPACSTVPGRRSCWP